MPTAKKKIMKFSAGKPRLQEIRAHIASTWDLEKQPAVGYLDPRHVTLNMASQADTKKALACPSNKIDTSLFRLFRWTPDFEIGRESSFVAVWVKFYNLPLHYYNESALQRLGSLIWTVLRADDFTLDLMHQVYARVCIEMDVTQEFENKLWIGTSKENGWMIDVEYEGNHATTKSIYQDTFLETFFRKCLKYNILGHLTNYFLRNFL